MICFVRYLHFTLSIHNIKSLSHFTYCYSCTTLITSYTAYIVSSMKTNAISNHYKMLTFALCQAALELMMMYDDGGQHTLMMICDRAVLELDTMLCTFVTEVISYVELYVLLVYIVPILQHINCDNLSNFLFESPQIRGKCLYSFVLFQYLYDTFSIFALKLRILSSFNSI